MKSFQTILLVIFGFAFVGALIYFAVAKGSSNASLPAITVWGTLPTQSFNAVLELARKDPAIKGAFDKLQLTYEEKQDSTFDGEFVEALASGTGPDAVIISQDMLLRHKNKLFPITGESIPPRNYKDWFVPMSSIFQDKIATYALPLFVDPMVMYWNVDILANEGYTAPPRAWIEFADFAKKVTKRDPAGNIRQSAFALGEYGNIPNAKDLVANLLLQAGIPLTGYDDGNRLFANITRPLPGSSAASLGAVGIDNAFRTTGEEDGIIDASIVDGRQSGLSPAISALRFYTDFANPAKAVYSWNRALPRARDSFAAGDSALYFGAASEKPLIQAKNPNLNFDVAFMPQITGAKIRTNFGRMYGFGIVAKSPRYAAAFTAGTMLMDPTVSAYFARTFYAAPARNEALVPGFVAAAGRPSGASAQTDTSSQMGQVALAREADQVIFNQSALSARGWLDPDRSASAAVFKSMIESVVSGQADPAQALSTAESRIGGLLPAR